MGGSRCCAGSTYHGLELGAGLVLHRPQVYNQKQSYDLNIPGSNLQTCLLPLLPGSALYLLSRFRLHNGGRYPGSHAANTVY